MGNFNRDNRPGRRDFGGRDFGGGRPMMHRVTCSDCGKECEVPFRPTGERPVFCNDCFRNHRNASPSRPERTADQYKGQFEIINIKLDKILNALNPVVPIKNKSVLVKKAISRKKGK